MSINLEAKTQNGTIELWQTPSWVTRACLIDCYGDVKTRRGPTARHALQIYLLWVSSQLEGVWHDVKAFENMKEAIRDHVAAVRDRMRERGLVVSSI